MKQVFSVVLLIVVLSLTSYTADNGKHYSIKTIVIDPGHGGHDSGCLGSSSKEKDVALAISLKLGKYIEENFKDIKVIYTRKTDVFIELHERAEIANANKADLFICIHCNSGPKEAFGTETYVMGLHRTESNLNVAKRENSSILMETDYKSKYDGFDPNSPEANIIFTLYQNAFLDQSLALSSHIQTQFKEKLGRYSRGVKQAGFLVLYKTTMPSILIETGFLTHPVEEKYLASEDGQVNIAEAIYKAFRLYKRDIESNGKTEKEDNEDAIKKENSGNHKPDVKNEKEPLLTKEENVQAEKEKKKGPEIVNKPDKKDSIAETKQNSQVINKAPERPVSYPQKTIYERHKFASTDSINNKEKGTVDTNVSEKTEILFKVQIGSAKDLKVLNSKKYKDLPNIKGEQTGKGIYVLYYGETAIYKEVIELQAEARKKGFKEAFAVAFNNHKRIAINDALSLLKKK